ncbi:nicotinamide N-methyltransferase-like [Hyperolius riggenbachi]|uniref:nicotinamide N-methyltransferase-like n=1 Tax=Hyperolius riggenbachi TaxID=752182 RepID=UPI0035A2DD61
MSDFTEADYYQRHFDPKAYLKTYYRFSGHSVGDEYLRFVLKHLAEIFTSGKVTGETLIDIGTGPTIYNLLSACEAFKNIILTDFADRNREELNTWLTNQPGAFDWSPVVKYVCQLEGDRITWKEKEARLRKAVKQVLKCDVLESNPTNPVVLPQADCLLSCLCLEGACKDLETFVLALNNITTLLKPGGYLVLTGVLEDEYYMVGEVRFSALSVTEDFLKESVCGAGYVIEDFQSSKKMEETWKNIAEFSASFVLVARKND